MSCPCMRYEPDPGLCGIPDVPPCPENWTSGSHCRCTHFPIAARDSRDRALWWAGCALFCAAFWVGVCFVVAWAMS